MRIRQGNTGNSNVTDMGTTTVLRVRLSNINTFRNYIFSRTLAQIRIRMYFTNQHKLDLNISIESFFTLSTALIFAYLFFATSRSTQSQ